MFGSEALRSIAPAAFTATILGIRLSEGASSSRENVSTESAGPAQRRFGSEPVWSEPDISSRLRFGRALLKPWMRVPGEMDCAVRERETAVEVDVKDVFATQMSALSVLHFG